MHTNPMQHILVPIDFSSHSALALRWAAVWQATFGSQVTVLHSMHFEPPLEFTTEQLDELVDQAHRSQDALAARAHSFLVETLGSDPGWQVVVEERDPVQSILHWLGPLDLVIMGTHGRQGYQRWKLGGHGYP